MKKLICIMGTSVSSGNRGVQAIGASLVKLCTEADDLCEIILMVGHNDNQPVTFRIGEMTRQLNVVNCRLSPYSRLSDHLLWIFLAAVLYRAIPMPALRSKIARFSPWIATIVKADIVGDVHGGDSFSDIYGMRRLINEFIEDWTILLVKGSMVQFPQTFGPYKSVFAKWIAQYLLKRSSVIIARDVKSMQVAQQFIRNTQKVWISPDVAFALDPVRPPHIHLYPPLNSQKPTGVIGLNVNGLMANGGYNRKNMFGLKLDYRELLPDLVKALLCDHPGELWLIPHTFGPAGSVENDTEASRHLRQMLPEKLQQRVRIVDHEYDQHEIKWIVGECDFFIGSRMHACIAALSQGIPCVGIAYSMKFEGVFDSVGMHGWVIDGRVMDNDQAINRIMALYRERDSVRDELKINSDKARIRLSNIFKKLVTTIDHPMSTNDE